MLHNQVWSGLFLEKGPPGPKIILFKLILRVGYSNLVESLCSHGLAGMWGRKTSLHIRGGLGPQVAGDRPHIH